MSRDAASAVRSRFPGAQREHTCVSSWSGKCGPRGPAWGPGGPGRGARHILSQYSARMSRNRPQHFSGTVMAVRKLLFTCNRGHCYISGRPRLLVATGAGSISFQTYWQQFFFCNCATNIYIINCGSTSIVIGLAYQSLTQSKHVIGVLLSLWKY